MSPPPRLATAQDRSAVEALVEAAYAHYVPRIGRKPGPMLDDYGALIQAGRVSVIDRDDRICALLVLIPQPDALLLDNIAVAPDAQGTGLGRVLLAFAETTAIRAGYRSVTLYTHEAMTENIALYCKLGYVETHRAEENGFRRVYMRKALPAG